MLQSGSRNKSYVLLVILLFLTGWQQCIKYTLTKRKNYQLGYLLQKRKYNANSAWLPVVQTGRKRDM